MTTAGIVGLVLVFAVIIALLFIFAPKEEKHERPVQRQELPREDAFGSRQHRDFWRH